MADAVTIEVDAWGDVVFAAASALAARPFHSSLTVDDDALLRAVLDDALRRWSPRGVQAVTLADGARRYVDRAAEPGPSDAEARFGLRKAVCGYARWRAGVAYDRVRG